MTFEALKQVCYTRRQFPLQDAFAITIHKSQGLSSQCAIADAGSRYFGPRMIIAALSRVTSSAGLHVVELGPTKILPDSDALLEYNRLRKIYSPDLQLFQVPVTNLRSFPVEASLFTEKPPSLKQKYIGYFYRHTQI